MNKRTDQFELKLMMFLIMIVFLSRVSPARSLNGNLYEISSTRNKILYRWEMTLTPEGLPLKSEYKSLDGAIVAWDEVIWKDDRFMEYRYQRDPIHEKGSIKFENNAFLFTHTINGKHRQKTEAFRDNFVCGPLVVLDIQSHWDQLSKGEERVIRYGVIDQLSSFEFVLSHDHSHPQNVPGQVVFKMRANNFLIRFFIDPIYLVFREMDHQIIEIIGRTLPVSVDKNGMHPIDADLVINRGK